MFDLPAEGMAANLATQIRERGFGVMTHAFSAHQIAEAASAARRCLAEKGAEYLSIAGPIAHSGDLLGRLCESEGMKSLLSGLHGELFARGHAGVTVRQMLRCLSGKVGRKHALYFHYDYSVLTAVIPIAMPQSGPPGDLLIYPRSRPIRRTYLANVADKALSDLLPSQVLIRLLRHGPLRPVRVRLVPGNLYIFLGYQSLHTNEPGNPAELRATLVLHSIDPHEHDPLRNWMKMRRGRA